MLYESNVRYKRVAINNHNNKKIVLQALCTLLLHALLGSAFVLFSSCSSSILIFPSGSLVAEEGTGYFGPKNMIVFEL